MWLFSFIICIMNSIIWFPSGSWYSWLLGLPMVWYRFLVLVSLLHLWCQVNIYPCCRMLGSEVEKHLKDTENCIQWEMELKQLLLNLATQAKRELDDEMNKKGPWVPRGGAMMGRSRSRGRKSHSRRSRSKSRKAKPSRKESKASSF